MMAALTRYGKIVNGEFESAPLNMEVEGHVVCNVFLQPDLMARFGYKPVRTEGTPVFDEETGETPEPTYTDNGDCIIERYREGVE